MTTNPSDRRRRGGPQPADIAFRLLTADDLPLMHRWLNTPHVREWWHDPATYDAVATHYLPRIEGRDPARPFVILCRQAPIGYIQAYRYGDHPDFSRHLALSEDAAGLDLFIGEAAYVHRGWGRFVLTSFMHTVTFADPRVPSCIVLPEPENTVAIRCYDKTGFRHLKTIRIPGERTPRFVMRCARDALTSRDP